MEGAQPGNQRVPIFTKSLFCIINLAKCQVKLPIITNKFKSLITNRPIWNAFCPTWDSHPRRRDCSTCIHLAGIKTCVGLANAPVAVLVCGTPEPCQRRLNTTWQVPPCASVMLNSSPEIAAHKANMIITQRKREPPRGEREGLFNSSSKKLIPGRIPNMRGPESQR